MTRQVARAVANETPADVRAQHSTNTRPYYGWVMVSALALTEMTSWGIIYYGFSVMLTPMQQDLGFSRAALTGAFSLALLLSGLAALPVGWLLDRYGARGVMSVGSCTATLLVLAWSHVQTLTALYLVWAALGVSMAAVLYEPAFVVVATWFERRRKEALTVLTFGGGLASVVYVPLASYLMQHYGWRAAVQVLAIILAITTIPLHAVLLRRHPHDLGVLPDGQTHKAEGPSRPQAGTSRRPLQTALGASRFWWVASAFAASVLASVVVTVHLIAYLTERGYAPGFAALALSVVGAAQIPGRLLFTPAAMRLPQRWVTAGLFAFQIVALLVLLAIPTTLGVLLFALLFGAGAGALTPARAALIADWYGTADYGSISGVLAFILTLARASAPVGAGLLYASTQSYLPLLWLLVGVITGGMVALLRASRQSHGAQRELYADTDSAPN